MNSKTDLSQIKNGSLLVWRSHESQVYFRLAKNKTLIQFTHHFFVDFNNRALEPKSARVKKLIVHRLTLTNVFSWWDMPYSLFSLMNSNPNFTVLHFSLINKLQSTLRNAGTIFYTATHWIMMDLLFHFFFSFVSMCDAESIHTVGYSLLFFVQW